MTNKRYSYSWPIIILISADLIALSTVFNFPPLIRIPIAFWFLLICPGMAYVRLFRIRDKTVEWVLALALSIAIDTILSEAVMINNLWSPVWVIFSLATIAILGALAQVALRIRQERSLT